MKKILYNGFLSLLSILVLLYSVFLWLSFFSIPSNILLTEGSSLSLDFISNAFTNVIVQKGECIDFDVSETGGDGLELKATEEGNTELSVMAFGALPLKKVSLEVVENKYVKPSGKLVGLKFKCDGLLIVDVDDVYTSEGEKSPGEIAGLKKGDYILGTKTKNFMSIKDFVETIQANNGYPLNLVVRRDNKRMEVALKAEKSTDTKDYKVGLWLREGIAGIGTLTFVEKQSGVYGSLGHGILDVDTNEILPAKQGEIMDAEVVNVVKGEVGKAGEIRGVIVENELYGNIESNTVQGIYGKIEGAHLEELPTSDYPVATRFELKEGKAQIMSDIDNKGPRLYDVMISNININAPQGVKGFVITVVDEALLKATGGIVQGMSGSPVIQNGKLVGAVTHVLVNEPTKGYGIFIENMLEHN